MIESKGHKITPIDGDLAVSRNAEIGGDADIHGKARVAGGLKVEGFLDAPNIKGAVKGLFATEEELKREYPNPRPGWCAIVLADNKSGFLYLAKNREWEKQSEEAKPFDFIVDSINVFASKSEIEEAKQELSEAIRLNLDDINAETNRATEAENEIKAKALKADTVHVEVANNSVKILGKTLDGNGMMNVLIPAATAENAGVMSAVDKVKVNSSFDYVNTIEDKHFDVSSLSVGNANTRDIGTTVSFGKLEDWRFGTFRCKVGQLIKIDTQGSLYAARPFAFCDKDLVILQSFGYDVGDGINKGAYIAPEGTEYIVVNCTADYADKFLLEVWGKQTVPSSIDDRSYTASSLWVGNAATRDVGTTVSFGKLANWRCGVFRCKTGQLIKINTQGGIEGARPFAFCDKNLTILQTSGKDTGDGMLNGEFRAPEGTEYIVVNCTDEYAGSFSLEVQGKIADAVGRYNEREENVDEIIKNLGVYTGKILTIDDLDVGAFYRGEVGEQIEKGSNTEARSLWLRADRLNNIKVKSNSTANAAPIIYTNADGIIIGKSEASVDGIYNIPENAVLVHINAYPNTNNADFSLCVNVEDEGVDNTDVKLFPLPKTLYAIKGQEKSVYLSAITNGNDYAPYYTMDVYRGADVNYDGRRFFVTPTSAGKVSVTLRAINNCGEIIGKRPQYIQTVDNVVTSTKRILCIGDSITEGRAEGDIQTNVPYHIKKGLDKYVTGASNVIFVGSKGNPVKHEGWWGKTYQWLAGDKEESDVSPFVNPSTGEIDITYYKTEKCGIASSDTIDIVSLAMGYNGTDTKDKADQAFASMTKLMGALREDNPNTKFIVQLVTYPPVGIMAHGAWMSIGAKKQSHEYYRELCLKAFGNGQDSNVIVGDWGIGVDREYAYVVEEKQVSPYFDNKINVITDSAHPTYKGAIQLAENILGCLVYAMQL